MAQEQTTNDADVDEEKLGLDELQLGVHCTKDDRLKVTVQAPKLKKGAKRPPAMVSCVVDVSGSMFSEAVIKDANGKTESHGLAVLDLVKHAIKTIINCLEEDDYLSIVSYSNKAKVVTELMKMTEKNKKTTLAALDNLEAAGQTNLWDGLYNGLEQLRKCTEISSKNSNSAVLLFTDGLPNIIPPKGHIAMLEKYIDTNQELSCVINTYGFGYSLDTKLLTDLATKGNGTYSFIPDSSFVGTIFVNSISNFCCNIAKNVRVKITTNAKKWDAKVIGGYEYDETSWGLSVNLGNVAYGQNRDIVIKFEPNANADSDADDNADEGKNDDNDSGNNNNAQNAKNQMFEINANALNYISLRNGKQMQRAGGKIVDDDDNHKKTEINYYRLKTCDVLRECMMSMKLNDMDDAQKKLKDLIKTVQSNKLINREKYVIDLLTDLSGQAFEAISKKEYYDKWGKHYLPSLICAHLNQFNNNFKDPGVQHYGGGLFNTLRDKGNDIFIKLPAPKPSRPQFNNIWGGNRNKNKNANKKGYNAKDNTTPKAAPRQVDMSAYYNQSGGCFHGHCTVEMNDNSLKFVKDLKRGDKVKNGATVKCVIRHKCENNKMILSTLNNFNGLKITPFHPIRINNEWVFPNDVDNGNQRAESCEFVYNFILSDDHILMVNGIECCTLAHNFAENDVIKHEYFGTNKIVEDLRKFNGWKHGLVTLEHNSAQRNPENNLVVQIQ